MRAERIGFRAGFFLPWCATYKVRFSFACVIRFQWRFAFFCFVRQTNGTGARPATTPDGRPPIPERPRPNSAMVLARYGRDWLGLVWRALHGTVVCGRCEFFECCCNFFTKPTFVRTIRDLRLYPAPPCSHYHYPLSCLTLALLLWRMPPPCCGEHPPLLTRIAHLDFSSKEHLARKADFDFLQSVLLLSCLCVRDGNSCFRNVRHDPVLFVCFFALNCDPVFPGRP